MDLGVLNGKYVLKTFFAILFMLVLSSNSQSVSASNIGEGFESPFPISVENKELIENLSKSEPANRDYIISSIKVYGDATSPEDTQQNFNIYLKEVLVELKNFDASQNELLDNAINKGLEDFSKSRVITPYPTAVALYRTGIAIVDRVGHWQTANYMRHAIVPADKLFTSYTPSTYYNNNDTWARMVDSEELMKSYYARLKAEAFQGGKTSGSFSGWYTFTSGHLRTALQGVSYTVSYKKQANGNYFTSVKVTDIFDFEWELKGYNNSFAVGFAVGFGNNYCFAVQSIGAIKPYKIEIVRSISR
ncbi:MAG: hypothetical protein LBV67_06965 [Streptococcaceae bacterium]|nr:hypothetical protein [Streptococcaceae bacterium]